MNNFEEFKDKYGPLITDPYASCVEDEHWESIHRAKVAACNMGRVTPSSFLKVWATDEVDGVWSIRPLNSPGEFDEDPIGTFWVTTKPRDTECKETYIWVEGG